MKNRRTLDLTQLGVFSAIIIILAFTPLGVISFGAVSATTLHIPVIIGAVVLGPRYGTILGGVMGLSTLLRAAIMPASVLDPLFVNPLLSVLPRLLLGLFAGLVFVGVKKLLGKFLEDGKLVTSISSGVAALAGTLTNTIFVLGFLALIYAEQVAATSVGVAVSMIFGVIISTNGLIEILSAVILSIPVSLALIKLKSKLDKSF
ncbi:membrane protein [Clostridia bacterium]|nr:membrane protein [Clostridia bacterium]